jgi:hypothetical protein
LNVCPGRAPHVDEAGVDGHAGAVDDECIGRRLNIGAHRFDYAVANDDGA